MLSNLEYKGSITAEQFLFYEMRLLASMYLNQISLEDIITRVNDDNLFQYPTEREVTRMARVCYKRLEDLSNENLIRELAQGPIDLAKQINLYALMRHNLIVREFMINVVGEKFRSQDFFLSRADVMAYMTELQQRDERVGGWSHATINKIVQVLRRILLETGYIDEIDSEDLIPVFISEELLQGIRDLGDEASLIAFNYYL